MSQITKTEPLPSSPTQDLIARTCDMLKAMLLEKNRRYGNSALDPVRVLSKASPREQILVRMDDKISRLQRGTGPEAEDVWLDLAGYIVLLLVHDGMVGTKG